MVGYAFATRQPRVLASRTLVANASSGQQRPVLRRRDGSSIEMPEGGKGGSVVIVGSRNNSNATIRVEDERVQDEHCQFEYRSGRLFCRSLTAVDEDSLIPTGDTCTFMNGAQIRPAVDYMVSPGTKISFGCEDGDYVVAEFDESSNGQDAGLSEMLMKGMAASASNKDVQDAVHKTFNDT
mmetsp:Transcript_366/g.840  ORF Transcript_366/g.840 Transcript_366/m.840 type:complete len:181 (-) Transcript_366:1726-2268(-)